MKTQFNESEVRTIAFEAYVLGTHSANNTTMKHRACVYDNTNPPPFTKWFNDHISAFRNFVTPVKAETILQKKYVVEQVKYMEVPLVGNVLTIVSSSEFNTQIDAEMFMALNRNEGKYRLVEIFEKTKQLGEDEIIRDRDTEIKAE